MYKRQPAFGETVWAILLYTIIAVGIMLVVVYIVTVSYTHLDVYKRQDVHSQVELMLTRKLGDVGKKIHSGRSRNDQVRCV